MWDRIIGPANTQIENQIRSGGWVKREDDPLNWSNEKSVSNIIEKLHWFDGELWIKRVRVEKHRVDKKQNH